MIRVFLFLTSHCIVDSRSTHITAENSGCLLRHAGDTRALDGPHHHFVSGVDAVGGWCSGSDYGNERGEERLGGASVMTDAVIRTRGGDFPGGPVAKTPNSQGGGPGSIPGWGTRSHRPQLRVCTPRLKIRHAATRSKIPSAQLRRGTAK